MPKPASPTPATPVGLNSGRSNRWFLLSAAGLAAMFLALSIQKIWNVDIWWQLSTGRWIVEHHSIPRIDQFSYTAADHPWIELRWVFCVLAFLGWKLGDMPLLILAQSAIMASVFGLIIINTRPAARTAFGMAILGLGVFSFASRFVVRPELITYLIVAIFLIILHGATRGRMKKLVWLLPVLQVVWVNSHTLFVMGPVIAWFFAGGYIARRIVHAGIGWPESTSANNCSRRFALKLCLIALLVTIACIINPYGITGAMFPITLWREIHKGSFLGNVIEEFKSPLSAEALTPDIYAAGVLALVAGATFLWNWRRLDFTRLALWAAHVYLACIAVRNVGLLSVVGTWIAMANVADVMAAHKNDLAQQPLRVFQRLAPFAHIAMAVIYFAMAWYVVSDRFGLKHGVQTTGLGINPGSIASGAVLFMVDREVQPNVFHDMADGSYLTWTGGDQFKVFIDPRLEVYGEEAVKRAISVTSDNFQKLSDEFHINTVLLNTKRMNELGRWLRQSREWVPVYLDERNIVFVRNIPQHADLIAAHRLDLSRPWVSLKKREPDESPSGLHKMIGGVSRPWFSLGMARGFALLGSIDNAERYLRRALVVNPEHGETRLMLAQIEKCRGNVQEANALLSGLPLTSIDRQWADRTFAQMFQDQAAQLRDQGLLPKVIPILEGACRASPNDGELLSALGLGYLESKNYQGAATAYRVLTHARPHVAEYWINLGRALEGAGDSLGAAEAYRRALAIDSANDVAKQGLSRIGQ